MTDETLHLFTTKKEKIFDFLNKHPDRATPAHLRAEFPDDKKSTISAYLKDWNLTQIHNAEMKEYIKDIYALVHVMKYKMMHKTQWSTKETQSFERIGLLLEKYRDLWAEPVPIPKTPPKPKPKKEPKQKWKLDFNGD